MTADPAVRIRNRIESALNTAIGRITTENMKLIQKKLDRLQRSFFISLARMAIGVDEPPDLGRYTPEWKPLTPTYARRRKREKGISEGQYYLRTGGLRRSLSQSKAITSFGRPVIELRKAGSVNRKRAFVFDQIAQLAESGRFVSLKDIKNVRFVISIDLFPKVKESLKSGRIHENRYFSEKISVKMTNFRGKRERPILAQFMNWWLDVRARNLVRSVLRS